MYVFPLHPGKKTPITEHGCKDATVDENQIRMWWAKWPTANIGLACGDQTGLYVVDIDVKDDANGFVSLQSFPSFRQRSSKTPRIMVPTISIMLPFLLQIATVSGRELTLEAMATISSYPRPFIPTVVHINGLLAMRRGKSSHLNTRTSCAPLLRLLWRSGLNCQQLFRLLNVLRLSILSDVQVCISRGVSRPSKDAVVTISYYGQRSPSYTDSSCRTVTLTTCSPENIIRDASRLGT